MTNFDDSHRRSITLRRLLISSLIDDRHISDQNIPKADFGDIAKHVQSLKIGKAADIFGITSEHIKYASPRVISILKRLVNKILQSGELPEEMKTGLVTPVLKKGKPANQPDSYRRITVTSVTQ